MGEAVRTCRSISPLRSSRRNVSVSAFWVTPSRRRSTKAYVYLFTQSLQSEVEDTPVRVQLVLPGAVVSEGWEVAGGNDLKPRPPEIVMSTEDLVRAALRGLDLGEKVTAPSVQDEALLRDYEAAGSRALQGAFDATPAARYAEP